jgi:hypothetical protein
VGVGEAGGGEGSLVDLGDGATVGVAVEESPADGVVDGFAVLLPAPHAESSTAAIAMNRFTSTCSAA